MISMRSNAGRETGRRGPMSQPAQAIRGEASLAYQMSDLARKLAAVEERARIAHERCENLRRRVFNLEQLLGTTTNSAVQARRRIYAGEIVRIVAKVDGIAIDELIGPGRHKSACRSRWLAALVMRRELKLSSTEIAKALHRADHTSALLWLRTARKLMPDDAVFAERYEECARQFGQIDLEALEDG